MDKQKIRIRPYRDEDLPAMVALWNEIVAEGRAFPQELPLSLDEGREFFAVQNHCGVGLLGDDLIALYILHPNNVGRCGHIANASFAIAAKARGRGLGEDLVKDCLAWGKKCGFRILQFNAVTDSNTGARKLYARLGFQELGTIPGGFRRDDGSWEDIHLFWKRL